MTGAASFPSAQFFSVEGRERFLRPDLDNCARTDRKERIDAWRKAGLGITYTAQCKSLTQIRHDLPEDWAQSNCSAQKPGFPRFKALSRMPGIGFKGHGDGLRFSPNLENHPAEGPCAVRWTKYGSLRLQGIGHIPTHQKLRTSAQERRMALLGDHRVH